MSYKCFKLIYFSFILFMVSFVVIILLGITNEIYGNNIPSVYYELGKSYLKGKVPDSVIYYMYGHDLKHVQENIVDLRFLHDWGIINY